MKKLYLSAAVMALCLTACKTDVKVETSDKSADSVSTVAPDTGETAEAEKPMDSAAMNKAWADYATPGEVHKLLADESGKWDAKITFWMDANAKPETSNVTAEAKMIMDGRYQETIYKGKMMGMDWVGKSTVAYNNKSKEITSTFIDNSGTGMMVVKGEYDPASKTMNLKGETVDIMTGKNIKFREVYTIVDNNTRKMEMFDTKNGKPEYKSMEIIMTRK